MVNQHTAKIFGDSDCGSRYLMFLVVEAQDSTYSRLNPSSLLISEAHGMKAHDMPCLVPVTRATRKNK